MHFSSKALLAGALLAIVALPSQASAEDFTCHSYGGDTLSCHSYPRIGSCYRGETLIDDSPTVKYTRNGCSITVICGTLNIHYYDGEVKTVTGPPCIPPKPALPQPQISFNDRYSTVNGVRSSNEIQSELLGVGYSGPFDVPSLLAAYQRTTDSPVRPL
jgi:hypothetical protein